MCMLNNKRFYQFIWREQYLQTFTERKLWVGLFVTEDSSNARLSSFLAYRGFT